MSREPSQVLEWFDNIVIIILFTTIDNIICMPIVHIQCIVGEHSEKDRIAKAITEGVSKILTVEKKGNNSVLGGSHSWKLAFFWCSSVIINFTFQFQMIWYFENQAAGYCLAGIAIILLH